MAGKKTDNAVLKSPNDQRDYKVVILPNQLEVLLVSDPETDQAAVSIDILAGQIHDPEDRQGLAHFLEHMLFLGNEKYPEPDEFGNYLSSHGGYSNAYTAFEDTNFFFAIQNDYLEGAIDRFSQFFISPLFDFQFVEREINAVNSEHNKNLKDDRRRIYRVLKSITNPKHPYHKFGTGNIETLKGSDKDYNTLQKQLIAYFENHYSANMMKLAVVAKDPIPKLEKLVTKYFSSLENKNLEVEHFKDKTLIDAPLPRRVLIEPVKSIRQLRLSFPMPSYREYYKNKPGSVISQLLGDEGKGSVLSYLKKKGWATSLSAGLGSGTRDFSFYGLEMTLTPEGVEHTNEIIQTIFQYIELIKGSGDLSHFYSEMRQMAEIGYQFKEKEEPINYARYLAANMQYVPSIEAPVSQWLYDKYRSDLVKEILSYLRVDNLQVVEVRPNISGDQTERWYGTQYRIDNINKDIQDYWIKPVTNPDLKLPDPNPFIPDNITLKPIEVKDEQPVLLKDSDSIRIWYNQSDRFRLPKGVLKIKLSSPTAYSSVENAAKTKLFVLLLRDVLNEYAYPASLAGLNYSLSNSVSGLFFNVVGYTENMPLLFNKIVETMKNMPVDEVQFAVLKNQMKERRINQKLSPAFQRITYESFYLLSETLWHTDEYLQVIDDITPEALKDFIPQLLSDMSIEVYSQGNFDLKEVNDISELLERSFGADSASSKNEVEERTMTIPAAPDYTYQFEVEDVNSAVELYYQVGTDSVRQTVLLDMIQQIIEKPFYHQLRTVEQLGYLVWSGYRQSNKVDGLYFIIQSGVKDPIFLEERIDRFLTSYLDELKGLSDTEFDQFREALISKRKEKPKNLNEESHRYWSEIVSKRYDFNRLEKEIEQLKSLNLSQVIDAYKTYIVNSDTNKKISIHAFGKNHPFRSGNGRLISAVKKFKSEMDYYPNLSGKINTRIYPN